MYIVAEDYGIKRAGEFLRRRKKARSVAAWEEFVGSHDRTFAPLGFALVTFSFLAQSARAVRTRRHCAACASHICSAKVLLQPPSSRLDPWRSGKRPIPSEGSLSAMQPPWPSGPYVTR